MLVAMMNEQVARILAEVAELLDLEGVAFKPRAYRRAAETVAALSTPIEELVARGTHTELPGVGPAIAKKIEEIVETGQLAYHAELKKALPIDLHALTQVEGVGPRTAKRLYDELGITDLDGLAKAARAGTLRTLKGFGAQSEARILRGLAVVQHAVGRIRLDQALALAEDLVEALRATGLFTRIEAAGSLRRGWETIGDLDLLGCSERPADAVAAFVALPEVRDVLAHGETKASVRLASDTQVDLRLVPPDSYGAALQYFTGSKAHNIALRKRAVARGWTLNEYGLFDASEQPLAGATEDGIYRALDLPSIPPELREDEGELRAAEDGTLPVLVELDDLRGDLHVHTDRSDGTADLAAMVAGAQAHGLSYIAVTDHVKFSEVIGGLTADALRVQIDEIAAWNETHDAVHVLTGIEVNIDEDGTLDLPDALLRRLDVVVAAVHSSLRLDRAAMTARLLRAVEHEHVDILAHPTARKIGERPGIEADWDVILERAAAAGTALEINANPLRLDLPAALVRRAISAGVPLSIGSDAHAPQHFDFLRLGVLTARRGWARAVDLLNAGAWADEP
jgi:DNA polymerase (family 10)